MRTIITLLLFVAGFIFTEFSTAQTNTDCNIASNFFTSDTTNCSITFTPSNYNFNYDYYWDFGDGNTSSSSHPFHQYGNSGSYDVMLIVYNDTCTDTLQKTITIAACDTICDLEASFTYVDTSNCQIAFSPTIFQWNANNNYFWNFGDGNTSNDEYPHYGYTTPGTYDVTLIVSNDTCADTLTQTIIVEPCPPPCTIDASFISIDSLCFVTFSATTLNSQWSYSWDFGDGNSSNSMDPNHQYDNSGSYDVTLIVHNDTCTDTLIQAITIACDSPCAIDANFTFITTDNLVYNFSPTVYNSSYNYHWVFGDGTISTDPYPSHIYTNHADYFVTLVVSDCSCSASETIEITVNDTINCGFNGNFTYNLEYDGSYTFTPDYQSLNYSYAWQFGDGSTSTIMTPNYSYLTNNTYSVSLIVWEINGTGNCSDTTEQAIQVSNASNCDISSNFTFSSDTSNNTFYFYPDIYNVNYTYSWGFGDGNTSTNPHPSHTYSTNGYYVVELQVEIDSCYSTDTMNIYVSTAGLLGESENHSEVNIFPNPASDFININFTAPNSEKVEVSLIDANGRLVKHSSFTLNKGEYTKEINIRTLSKGVYQILIQATNGTLIKRSKFIRN